MLLQRTKKYMAFTGHLLLLLLPPPSLLSLQLLYLRRLKGCNRV
jgi:hypothetical protein